MLKTKKEIINWLEEYNIENYTINDDLTVDVDGDVDLFNKGLNTLDVQFRNVIGRFDCSENELESLKGCPIAVGYGFDCNNNKLTNLEYVPQKIGDYFDCSINQLKNLIGSPEIINGSFLCRNNQLTSLKGGPKIVKGHFVCTRNQLTSLEYCPEEIYGDFKFSNNLVKSLEYIPKKITGWILGINNHNLFGDFNMLVYREFKSRHDEDLIRLNKENLTVILNKNEVKDNKEIKFKL